MAITAIIFGAVALCGSLAAAQPRLYDVLPSPRDHPLYSRHFTKPPELSLFESAPNCSCPGFAAIRGFNMVAPQTWVPQIELYQLQLNISNIVWPGYDSALAPNWPDLATLLASYKTPAVDLGGFVPGGMQASSPPEKASTRQLLCMVDSPFAGLRRPLGCCFPSWKGNHGPTISWMCVGGWGGGCRRAAVSAPVGHAYFGAAYEFPRSNAATHSLRLPTCS